MNAFGKKFLSAFVDISSTEPPEKTTAPPLATASMNMQAAKASTEVDDRFIEHFDQLFAGANLPRPDYYGFSKMIAMMQALPDEKSRYCTAFAGLQVQGMDKQTLLNSTHQYLQLLDEDANSFQRTVSDAFEEKVGSRKAAVEKAKQTLQELSQQIITLQEQIAQWTTEIVENEAKIQQSNSGYNNAKESCREKLLQDIKKINEYIL